MRHSGALAALAMLALAATSIGGQRTRAADNTSATAARVELGWRLFYDADLSRDGTLSCATCHEQRHGFADGRHDDSAKTLAVAIARHGFTYPPESQRTLDAFLDALTDRDFLTNAAVFQQPRAGIRSNRSLLQREYRINRFLCFAKE